MKKILLSIFVAASIFSSCSEDLLDLNSTTQVAADKVVKSESAIDAMRVGMYSTMAYNGGEASYTTNLPLLGDILGEDMVYGDTWYQVYGREYNYTSTENSSAPWQLWSRAYYVIEICNNIIKLNVEDLSDYVKDTDKGNSLEDKLNKYKAEAYVLRAMIHTDMARFFIRSYAIDKDSKCIPYVDDIHYSTVPGKVIRPERNTTKEVYEYAMADIKAAFDLTKKTYAADGTVTGTEPVLSQLISKTSSKYVSANVAYAVRSRMYLDMAGANGSAEQATYLPLAMADAIKAKEGTVAMDAHTLTHGGLSRFNSESIFTFAVDPDKYSKWRNITSFFDNYDGMGDDFRADIPFVDNFFYNQDLAGGKTHLDVRRLFFVMENDNPGNPSFIWSNTMNDDVAKVQSLSEKLANGVFGTYFLLKNSNDPDYSKTGSGYYTYGKMPRKDFVLGSKRGTLGLGDFSYIRYSEMELTIAECEARLGQTGNAIARLKAFIKTRLWGVNYTFTGSGFDNCTLETADDIYANNYEASISGLTGQALLDRIMWERRMELFGEGHRIRDIKRLGNGFERKDYKGLFGTAVVKTVHAEIINAISTNPNNGKFAFIVPKNEQNANPNIMK